LKKIVKKIFFNNIGRTRNLHRRSFLRKRTGSRWTGFIAPWRRFVALPNGETRKQFLQIRTLATFANVLVFAPSFFQEFGLVATFITPVLK